MIDLITKSVTETLIKTYNLQPQPTTTLLTPEYNQSGTGPEDIEKPIPQQTAINITPPIPAENVTEKSHLQDMFDNQKLLASVPKEYHSKALKLLQSINNLPMEISFTSDGDVYIDNKSIAEANFFKIFPALYTKSKTNIPGLSEVTTKLASLNLGHLFHKGMLKVFKRPKSYKFDLLSAHTQTSKNWWYIGE